MRVHLRTKLIKATTLACNEKIEEACTAAEDALGELSI